METCFSTQGSPVNGGIHFSHRKAAAPGGGAMMDAANFIDTADVEYTLHSCTSDVKYSLT
jgi:hypothetical protein